MGRTFDSNKDILKKLDDIAAAFDSDSSDASVDFEHTKNYDYGEDYVAALGKIEDAVKNSEFGDTVNVVSELSEGVKIATITVNGVDTDLFAPEGGKGGLVSNAVSLNSSTYTSENL